MLKATSPLNPSKNALGSSDGTHAGGQRSRGESLESPGRVQASDGSLPRKISTSMSLHGILRGLSCFADTLVW